jgi:hypothetical protein
MSRSALSRRGAAIALAATVGLTALVLAAPAGAANTNPQTYTAPATDPGTADAVSSVVVSSDSSGTISIAVNLAAPLTSTDRIGVYVDSDANPATGDPQTAGADYVLFADASDQSIALGAWNGSTWTNAASSSTLRAFRSGSQLTFSVNRSELGNTSEFNFWVDSCDGDCSPGHDVEVPATGTWSYQIAQSVKLTAPALFAPKTAKAGKTYAAAMIVLVSDPSVSFASQGQVTCTAKLGGKPVSAAATVVTATFQGANVSAAGCAVHVGKGARGKRLVGTITATYAGATVSRTFSVKVK